MLVENSKTLCYQGNTRDNWFQSNPDEILRKIFEREITRKIKNQEINLSEIKKFEKNFSRDFVNFLDIQKTKLKNAKFEANSSFVRIRRSFFAEKDSTVQLGQYSKKPYLFDALLFLTTLISDVKPVHQEMEKGKYYNKYQQDIMNGFYCTNLSAINRALKKAFKRYKANVKFKCKDLLELIKKQPKYRKSQEETVDFFKEINFYNSALEPVKLGEYSRLEDVEITFQINEEFEKYFIDVENDFVIFDLEEILGIEGYAAKKLFIFFKKSGYGKYGFGRSEKIMKINEMQWFLGVPKDSYKTFDKFWTNGTPKIFANLKKTKMNFDYYRDHSRDNVKFFFNNKIVNSMKTLIETKMSTQLKKLRREWKGIYSGDCPFLDEIDILQRFVDGIQYITGVKVFCYITPEKKCHFVFKESISNVQEKEDEEIMVENMQMLYDSYLCENEEDLLKARGFFEVEIDEQEILTQKAKGTKTEISDEDFAENIRNEIAKQIQKENEKHSTESEEIIHIFNVNKGSEEESDRKLKEAIARAKGKVDNEETIINKNSEKVSSQQTKQFEKTKEMIDKKENIEIEYNDDDDIFYEDELVGKEKTEEELSKWLGIDDEDIEVENKTDADNENIPNKEEEEEDDDDDDFWSAGNDENENFLKRKEKLWEGFNLNNYTKEVGFDEAFEDEEKSDEILEDEFEEYEEYEEDEEYEEYSELEDESEKVEKTATEVDDSVTETEEKMPEFEMPPYEPTDEELKEAEEILISEAERNKEYESYTEFECRDEIPEMPPYEPTDEEMKETLGIFENKVKNKENEDNSQFQETNEKTKETKISFFEDEEENLKINLEFSPIIKFKTSTSEKKMTQKEKKEEEKEEIVWRLISSLKTKIAFDDDGVEELKELLGEFVDFKYKGRTKGITPFMEKRYLQQLIEYSEGYFELLKEVIARAVTSGWQAFYPINPKDPFRKVIEKVVEEKRREKLLEELLERVEKRKAEEKRRQEEARIRRQREQEEADREYEKQRKEFEEYNKTIKGNIMATETKFFVDRKKSY